MKVNESYLAWIPGSDYVEVLPYGKEPRPGSYTGLGCYFYIKDLDVEGRKAMGFITAMQLIIRDKVDPTAVHNAMLELDEYQDGIALDMPGKRFGVCGDELPASKRRQRK